MPLVFWSVFVAAAVLLFVTAWIVVPGWTYPLLVLTVGAPEYSVWLLLASALVTILALTLVAPSKLSYGAAMLGAAAAILAATPLARVPSTIRKFDAEMVRALGPDFLRSIPAPVLDGMRPRAIDVGDLFRGINFGTARVVRGASIDAPDGHRLSFTVYRPERDGQYPALVQIYGGAWQRGTSDDDPEFATYFAAHGFVVFAIDYRHAPASHWPAQIVDVRAAVAWVLEHGSEYSADVSRLALMGRSAGAHLALLTAYGPGAPPIQAVVSYYGPVDLTDGYRRPPMPDPMDVRSIDEALLDGTPDTVPARYQEASPLTYVTGRLPPTLLVYGRRDHVVEARFGTRLHQQLLATGTRSALLEIPWAEHGFDLVPRGLSQQLALYYTERFLAWALHRVEPN